MISEEERALLCEGEERVLPPGIVIFLENFILLELGLVEDHQSNIVMAMLSVSSLIKMAVYVVYDYNHILL